MLTCTETYTFDYEISEKEETKYSRKDCLDAFELSDNLIKCCQEETTIKRNTMSQCEKKTYKDELMVLHPNND